jgi:hypothetical protein
MGPVNLLIVIIWVMGSVYPCPKVITISSFHCTCDFPVSVKINSGINEAEMDKAMAKYYIEITYTLAVKFSIMFF